MIRKKPIVISLALLCTLSLSVGASAEPAAQPQGQAHTISWPDQQQLPTFAKVKRLEVADIYDAPGDIKLLLSTLQGIVNRKEPRIYLIESKEEGKLTWLNDLEVPFTLHDDYWDIVNAFKSEAKGVIVYDPQLPDSINVATTLAGLKNAVVASPELAQKLAAAPYHLPVVDDLRGRFKDRVDAYSWQFDHLWGETTHRMLIGLSPDTSIRLPEGNFASFKTIAEEPTQERDAKNRKEYDLDLSGFLGKESVYLRFEDAFPQDGWGPAVHEVTVKADGQVIAHFIPGTAEEEPYLYDRNNSQLSSGNNGHRFADNGRYFVYQFSAPAGTKQLTATVDMWNQFKISASNVKPVSSDAKEPYGFLRDYAVANKAAVFWLDSNVPQERELFEKMMSDVKPGTPYLGWFSNDVAGEFSGVEITSRHGVYVLAADYFGNMTVFSGTKAKQANPKPVKTPKLENKIYVTYTFGEGDNLQYNEHRMRVLWDDPSRGKVPINWTSSPLLYDAAPTMLNHYLETATANDRLVAGPSGAGYFYPNAWPDNSFASFLKQTYSYMKKTGMTIPYVLNRVDGQNLPLSETKAAAYRDEYRVPGLMLMYDNPNSVEVLDGGLPVSTLREISTVADGKKVLADAKANWDGNSPLFVSVALLAWNMTPTQVYELNSSLGPEYQAVTADQYFALIRQANGLPAKP
ncbi:GxGYxYP family putative glycoside hydrolase [Paenibacillus sp. VCA1]|uniref:GxGYxYP domain-containing protein n=1 Tax=Paenibacillus sp. VCA1 TaxID=3039148 RepID=UPI0028726AB8|nr:GxGYxYP domain-containing protein [Paenibacillus sp. VCA1]MDR9856395.1 GxGYxYP family putative glycoside hydrolase [Paenibacillus sp. VCA1]